LKAKCAIPDSIRIKLHNKYPVTVTVTVNVTVTTIFKGHAPEDHRRSLLPSLIVLCVYKNKALHDSTIFKTFKGHAP
jgi:hypothetical protein